MLKIQKKICMIYLIIWILFEFPARAKWNDMNMCAINTDDTIICLMIKINLNF